LDEPTNDLDVQTLAVLEEYLEDFNGCVIVVSHDRYFLDRTVDTIFAFEAGGGLRQYPGNYSVYLDYKRAEEEEKTTEPQKHKEDKKTTQAPESENPKSKIQNPKSDLSRKLSFKEKREYEMLETQIPELEREKEEIEKILYNIPPSDFTEMQQLTAKLAQLTETIDTATERWLELAERTDIVV
jgi:ATP-binding cassette subfamily F protein uup